MRFLTFGVSAQNGKNEENKMILPTFISISESDVTTTIGYTADFLGDILPLFLPIIGLAIGILIFRAIIKVK